MLRAANLLDFPGVTAHIGNTDRVIEGMCSLTKPQSGCLLFCKKGYEEHLSKVRGCTVIVSGEHFHFESSNTYLVSDNPRLLFARIARKYPTKVSHKVTIHPSAQIGESVYIEGRVSVGENVIIQPQCTIGVAGFGLERDENGEFVDFPQIGGVVIEKNVSIASRSNVHRGTLEDTIIGEGSKVSIHSNVGHNSIVGKHTFLAGKTNLGGKTRIGDYSYLGMGAITRPGISIGSNVIIGMGSIVTKNIPDGVIAWGNPAKVMKDNPEIWRK